MKFEGRGLVLIEKRTEEMFNGISLFLVQKREIGHILPLGNVQEQLVRFHHVVVDVLKIAQHRLHQRVELVERFCGLHLRLIDFPQGHHQCNRVTNRVFRQGSEQFADGGVVGSPHGQIPIISRQLSFLPQIVVEKQTRTFIGENNCCVLKVALHLIIEVISYKFKKRGHEG